MVSVTMKKVILGITSLWIFSFHLSVVAAVKVGETAPDFSLKTSLNEQVALSDFKGKTVVLEWANYGCPFVKKHYNSQNMQQLQTKYTQQGVVWLTIMSSAPGKQGYFELAELEQQNQKMGNKASFVLQDASGEVGQAYQAKTTPHMFVIDPQGILRYQGAIDSIASADAADIAKAQNYVDLALIELAKNMPVTTAATQPYGCSVKY